MQYTYQWRQAVKQKLCYKFCIDFYKQLKVIAIVIVIGNFVIVIVIDLTVILVIVIVIVIGNHM